jgi:hypothetical protein
LQGSENGRVVTIDKTQNENKQNAKTQHRKLKRIELVYV